MKVDDLGAVDDQIAPITNDPEWGPAIQSAVSSTDALASPVTEDPPIWVTTDPVSNGASVTANEDEAIDWCAGARCTPPSADEPFCAGLFEARASDAA